MNKKVLAKKKKSAIYFLIRLNIQPVNISGKLFFYPSKYIRYVFNTPSLFWTHLANLTNAAEGYTQVRISELLESLKC